MLDWSLRRHLTLAVGLLAVAALGCALVFQGTEQSMDVRSDPMDATVTVDGERVGETPVSIKLKRNETHRIELSEAGYKTETFHLHNEMDAKWLVVDLVAAVVTGVGIIPLVVDAATGAWYTFEKSEIDVELQPGTASTDGPAYRIVIEGGRRIAGPTRPFGAPTPAPFRLAEPAE